MVASPILGVTSVETVAAPRSRNEVKLTYDTTRSEI